MEIKIVNENKKQFLDLLLLGDEQEDMIDKYLECGTLFALYDNDLKSICVTTKENDNTLEIKNLATYKIFQKQGYARALIEYICNYYKDQIRTIVVGTGDCNSSVSFYEKCGFKKSHLIKNFFIDNYNHPIFEDDKQLVDMIYLEKKL